MYLYGKAALYLCGQQLNNAMKNVLILFCAMIGLAASAQSVTIDESKASISFLFLDDEVEGTLSEFEFTGAVRLDDLPGSDFSGSVATASIDTNNWLRSRHLRAKKYFSAKKHPRISFVSKQVVGEVNAFTVVGDLTIKGITNEVSFSFVRQQGTQWKGTGVLNTQDFDISIHKERERNNVEMTLLLPYLSE